MESCQKSFLGRPQYFPPPKFHFLLRTRDFSRKRVCGFSNWRLQENIFNCANLFGGAIFMFPPINPPNPVSSSPRAASVCFFSPPKKPKMFAGWLCPLLREKSVPAKFTKRSSRKISQNEAPAKSYSTKNTEPNTYQPASAGNLPIPAKLPVNRWSTTLI
jgi:hypothetical protein